MPVLTRPVDRELTAVEFQLLVAVLSLSGSAGIALSQTVHDLRVLRESSSTWPIIEFTTGPCGSVIAEAFWTGSSGILGIHVLGSSGRILCLECWAVDGLEDPVRWPRINELRPGLTKR